MGYFAQTSKRHWANTDEASRHGHHGVMERIRFGWRNDRSSGRDGQARDFLKEGPYQFAELYRAATNAFLQGEAPSVDADEWEGSILSLIPKILGALAVKDNRPIARLCTKCITAYAAPSMRFRQVLEEYQLVSGEISEKSQYEKAVG